MPRNMILGGIAAITLLALPQFVLAVIYSPTQSELNSVEFTDFWPENGASLDGKELIVHPDGFNGVKYTFDTGYSTPTPDDFSRTQFEAPFTQDLSSFEAFSIDFLANSSMNPLQAQVYLRFTGGSGFAASTAVNINETTKTTASLPIGAIPVASRGQITAFGIEIFSLNLFDAEVDAMASAFTSPQPPEFTETVIFGFEGMSGEGSLDGWGPSFEPDHIAHSVSTIGVTEGSNSLDIVRQRTGEVFGTAGTSFRWGSQGSLNANAGGNPTSDYNNNGTVDAADYTAYRDAVGTMSELANDPIGGEIGPDHYDQWVANFGNSGGTDAAVQARIESIVDAINGGDELAFDVTFENVDQFPDDQPGYLGYHMAITDGSGGYWQSDDFGFPALPAVGESYEGLSLTVPLSSFTDRSANAFGDLATGVLTAENSEFNMILATNTGVGGENDMSQFTIAIQIDNIRVRTIIPQGSGALGTGTAVPEPSACVLILLSVAVLPANRRR